ncbi:FKBP-type peptidyl-prolyl cis-trans isomerase [Flammeovirga kamogawensis]|uniref:peptidylprolyl isomerase n=1 Tax=Flammeovirga kamogawensis TaxID=373891 RepID=A0ABX8GSG3_9BACT|nr:FKBP-type peptidyl-prolyl cis-trans isomerase [Flammeovirga kamogawensis]MBB6461441.1 hypothetical protein [Flammeovirga kamogawensis]QWG06336.1 FKBP-type peptidyl-prolyl cis-trans isomerase [Flammeovirga kamogawensis]TRX68164.1 FKBP-type peptidyl-prolyl cis-trans isomerase [Flammeovirga kamogawensis]
MNNTYKFLNFAVVLSMLIGFSGCMQDEIVDYVSKDNQTLEDYLAANDIDYWKTKTLPTGGVYITPEIIGYPGQYTPSENESRIVEVNLDMRRFAQELMGDERFDDPDDLVTSVFLKDPNYAFSMNRGAICIGFYDEVLNMMLQNIQTKVDTFPRTYIPSYLAFGGTASSGIGLEFNDIVTAENMFITHVSYDSIQRVRYEKDSLVLKYAEDTLGTVDPDDEQLFSGSSNGKGPDYIFKDLITAGDGAGKIMAGDTVKVRYEGKFLLQEWTLRNSATGPVLFDSNTAKDNKGEYIASPFQVIMYESLADAQENNAFETVIDGWYKSILTMEEGEKATFVMPSQVCYWEIGDNAQVSDMFKTIRPFKPLAFEIEVVEVKRSNK